MDAIVDAIFAGDMKKVLIVDKSVDFDEDCIPLFASIIMRRGLDVSINHLDDYKSMHCRSSSILAIMKKVKEVVIVFADASSKPNKLPKDIHAGPNKIIIIYIHTKLKKIPYPKKKFDQIFVIHNEDDENQYIRMSNELLNRQSVDDINTHDRNMVSLVLLHNLFTLKLPMDPLKFVYGLLVDSELMSTDPAYLQAISLLHAYKTPGAARCKKLEFTKHLSKYSVQSATRKKIALKMDFLMASDSIYEELLVSGAPCPEELRDIQLLFNASLAKMASFPP
jgi:hypothetical protein